MRECDLTIYKDRFDMVETLNKKYAREHVNFNRNPIEFLENTFQKISHSFDWRDGRRIWQLLEWNFNTMKEKYHFYFDFETTARDWLKERKYYGHTNPLPYCTPFTTLWDSHAELQSIYQCDECGTIVSIDGSQEESLMRLVCPTCNDLEDKRFPFPYSTIGDKEKWNNEMLYARVLDGGDYFMGNYSKCKFKVGKFDLAVYEVKRFFRKLFNIRYKVK
jgi:DNA-directed RNA polymerase subunit RPC12/RpoP